MRVLSEVVANVSLVTMDQREGRQQSQVHAQGLSANCQYIDIGELPIQITPKILVIVKVSATEKCW